VAKFSPPGQNDRYGTGFCHEESLQELLNSADRQGWCPTFITLAGTDGSIVVVFEKDEKDARRT
jgi:hypothetical protein